MFAALANGLPPTRVALCLCCAAALLLLLAVVIIKMSKIISAESIDERLKCSINGSAPPPFVDRAVFQGLFLPPLQLHSAQIPPLGAIKIHKKASQEKVAESFPIDDLPARPRQRGASAGAGRGRGGARLPCDIQALGATTVGNA